MLKQTQSTKPISAKAIKRTWHLIDVKGKIVGREIPRIAELLQGKQKVNYAPYLDNGDYVVVINAALVEFSGKKLQSKVYANYSGYPGGLRQVTAGDLLEKNPTRIIKEAVAGMLPKNKLRDRRMTRLYIYPGDKHPYESKFSKS